ncbi:HYR-like domain-containing protein, partial [Psychroserpens damuponensis]
TDECGNTTALDQIITIEDNIAPIIDVSATNIVIECEGEGNNLAIQDWLDSNGGAMASDSCGNVINWSNNYNGAVPDCTTPISVIFTATDACGNFSTTTATYAIQDTTPPVVTNAINFNSECNSIDNDNDLQNWLNSNGGATATDDCSSVTWSNDFTALSNECSSTGSAIVTFTATDGCGNSSSTTATFSIEDTTPPVITAPANNQSIECNIDGGVTEDILTWLALNGGASATDDCSDVIWSNNFTSLSDGCGETGSATVTFTATDGCGNSTSTTAVFNSVDTSNPIAPDTPEDLTFQCIDEVPMAGQLTARDNCMGTITVTGIDTINNSNPCNIIITRTWNFIDECGNSTSISQNITVADTIAPDITNCSIENTTLECDETENETLANAWNATNIAALEACALDSCDTDFSGQVTSNYDFDNLNTTCGPCGTINVTYTITDDCGNTSSVAATLTFDDGTIPDVSNCSVNDTAIECSGNDNEQLAGNWNTNNINALENCADDLGVTVTSNYAYSNLASTCGQGGTITVIYTITDDCDNATTLTAVLTLEDTTPPNLYNCSVTDTTIECSGDNNEQLANNWNTANISALENCVADSCNNDFNGQVTSDFAYTNIDTTCGQSGKISVIYTITDDCGNESILTVFLTIEDTTPPNLDNCSVTDTTIECSGDNNEQLANNWNTANISALENCVADSCNNDFNGQVTSDFTYANLDTTCGESGKISVIYTITDDCGNESILTAFLTIEDTTPPNLDNCSITDTTIECSGDNNEQLANNWNTANISALENCVADSCDNDFNGQVTSDFAYANLETTCGEGGKIYVIYTITDDCGNESTLTAILTIVDTIAPDITNCTVENTTLECDATENETLADAWNATNIAALEACAIDSCDTDFSGQVTSNYDFDNLNTTCGPCGTITVTYTITDDCGNTTALTATLTFDDGTIPDLSNCALEDYTMECIGDENATLVNDWNLNNIVTLQSCANDNAVTVTSDFDFANFVVTCGQSGTLKVIYTITDDCDNATTIPATLIIEDTIAPTFTVPADVTLECDQDPTDLTLTGDVNDEADLCSGVLEATYSDVVTDGSCINESIITRTWLLTDDCGNVTSLTQTITIQDTTAPTFTVPADVTLECDSDITDVTLTGDVTDEADNCSSGLDATYVDSITEGDCPNASIISRTWTLTDDCDNTTTLVQTITIQDTTAPTFTVPADVTLECDTDITDVTLTGDVTDEADNCSSNLDATYADSITEGDCPNAFIISRTWTLTDDCGNVTSLTQTITIQDTTAPTFTVPADVTLECDTDITDVTLTGDVTDEADN